MHLLHTVWMPMASMITELLFLRDGNGSLGSEFANTCFMGSLLVFVEFLTSKKEIAFYLYHFYPNLKPQIDSFE